MLVALCAVLLYLYGSIPFGYVAAFVLKGEKLTEKGTGNAGVTNAFKVGGTAVGIITVTGEISKAVVPVCTGRALFPDSMSMVLLLVFSSLVGTSYSIFLKGKGGKGSTAALWGILLLSPWSCLWLLFTGGIFSLLARVSIHIKKLQIICIPLVIHSVERDTVFTLFAAMTSLLFVFNSFRRKDDFVFYNIFQQQSGLKG